MIPPAPSSVPPELHGECKRQESQVLAHPANKHDHDGQIPAWLVDYGLLRCFIFFISHQFLEANGKLITCSLKEYTKNGILTSYRSLDNFLQAWNDAEKKKIIIEELESLGIIFEDLKEEIKSDLDIFDLICHIAWDAPALTRKERAENVRKRNYWTKYGEQARYVLNALLDKYAERGIENIEDMKILTVEPLKDMGTPAEIVKIFGGKAQYLAALRELENEIYRVA